MLNDLKQYFSEIDEEYNIPPIEKFYDSDNEVVRLLSQTIPLVVDDDIANRLIANVRDYSSEIADEYYSLDMLTIIDHWCDMLNSLCNGSTLNVIIKMILLTVFDEDEFYFVNTTDELFGYFQKETMKFKIESGYRKIDKFATHWLTHNTSYFDFETLTECEDDLYVDDDHTRFILDCVRIKDKSKARKLRKLYCRNKKIEKLFDDFGYGMVNGDFLFLGWIDTDSYDPFYFSASAQTILDGIEELQKEFNISVERDTDELAEVLDSIRAENTNYHLVRLIGEIAKIHNTSKEIIL